MKRWEAWWNHAALAAISMTGVVYGVFKYWVPSPDPDSRVGHPLQPGLMKAHLLVAPFAVFGVGLLLRRHAVLKIHKGETSGRATGLMMLWLFLPLVVTGYLIQILIDPGITRAAGLTHAAIGALVVLGYAFHPKGHAIPANASVNGNGND